jgi:hypothetical protein
MRVKKLSTVLMVILAVGLGSVHASAHAQDYQADPLEARVWLDRGHEPVLQRGETARVYYRVSEDAFVAIFHIDTNGNTQIVFPNSPQENHFARGGRDYRVLFPGSSYWVVNDDPGMGYFFIVASPEPFNFADLRYSHYNGGWDLSFVGQQTYRDPYLAMDDFVATLVPGWEYIPYGLDFTSYSVDQHYEFPRFMCYDCHGFRPYSTWNPYHYACSSFRMVIYNDPYYYPVTRYRGSRVVYAQPRRGTAHFSFKERANGEPGTPQVVVRNPPPVSQPGVDGATNRRVQPRNTTPTARSGGNPQPRSVSGSSGYSAPGGNGSSTTRRPAGGTAAPATPQPGRTTLTPPSSGTGRPVLERRPATGSRATSRTSPPASRTITTRPSVKVKVKRSGGGNTAATPRTTVRGGGTSASRSTAGSGGSRSTTSRPTVRSGGTSRSTTSRPATRSGGTSGTTTRSVPSRSGGSARSAPARTSRPAAARSGGSSRSAPARTARPPVKRRSGGGRG